MPCRPTVSRRPHCTSTCCSRHHRCGGPTSRPWVTPSGSPKGSRPHSRPPRSGPPPHPPPSNQRWIWTPPGSTRALGRAGTADGGVYKFTIARNDVITDGVHVLPPTFGMTAGINFQPVGGGKAVINGDLVMTAPEVQKVIQALRHGGIALVEVHNHSLTANPRLFFAPFCAVADAVDLAKAMRPALDATDLSRPSTSTPQASSTT